RRLAVATLADAEHSAHAFHAHVVRRPVTVGPGLAEGADGAVDDARVACAELRVADAEPVHDAGPEALDEHVRAVAELEQLFPVSGVLEVEHHALLAAVEIPEIDRAGPIRKPQMAHRV